MKSIAAMGALFEALSDPTRLRLLNLMSEGEVCVCFFVEILGEGQSKISRHLAYLRRVGLVRARRDGRWMHYGLARPDEAPVRHVLDAALEWMRSDPEMQRDRRRLDKVCCSVRLPEALIGAPMPSRSAILNRDRGS